MIKVGFTGTRKGLTGEQIVTLTELAQAFPPGTELHHGDCIGADAAAHAICKSLGWRVVIHPSTLPPSLRAFMTGQDELRPVRDPLDRNLDIVDETERLIACPATPHEEIRSGTWQTVRAARRHRRPVHVIWPDGSCDRGAHRGTGGSEARLDHATAAVDP